MIGLIFSLSDTLPLLGNGDLVPFSFSLGLSSFSFGGSKSGGFSLDFVIYFSPLVVPSQVIFLSTLSYNVFFLWWFQVR